MWIWTKWFNNKNTEPTPKDILREDTGIILPQDKPYKIKHPLRALQVKNRSTLAVPPFMSSMMSSTLHFSLSHPFCSSIPKVQEEAKTKPLTRTRRTLAKMMVDLAQCVYCTTWQLIKNLNTHTTNTKRSNSDKRPALWRESTASRPRRQEPPSAKIRQQTPRACLIAEVVL